MHVQKAVITAAADPLRLGLQTLVDRSGSTCSVLSILIEEALASGVTEIAVIVSPGQEALYADAAGAHKVAILPQTGPAGYGHAVLTSRDFVGEEPFLHLVGDHVYVSANDRPCARQVVDAAMENGCSVSGVQATREHLLPLFGAVGGHRITGIRDTYAVESVVEKPTPTQAEQTLVVPGLRAGHYLTFFGLHVLTPRIFEILEAMGEEGARQLSPALDRLAQEERYLALEVRGKRYPLDVKYGLLTAQLALGLSGDDRERVLSMLVDLLAQRELAGASA